MNDQEHLKEKPSFEEIVAGKDVALGKEIVENLKSEDIGVSIIKTVYTEKKTKIDINRKVGEENFSVRERHEFPSTLLGIVVPTENEGEYIYFGIEEQGFVFNTEYKRFRADLNPEINSVKIVGQDKFIEALAERDVIFEAKVTLKEDENGEEYNRIFAASVERERDKVKRKKVRRTETRKNLKQGLFGNKD
jgi:hypothetical protein